jgi:hypothetical protein
MVPPEEDAQAEWLRTIEKAIVDALPAVQQVGDTRPNMPVVVIFENSTMIGWFLAALRHRGEYAVIDRNTPADLAQAKIEAATSDSRVTLADCMYGGGAQNRFISVTESVNNRYDNRIGYRIRKISFF